MLGSASAQSTAEIDRMRQLNVQDNHTHNWSAYVKQSDNEYQLVFASLFVVYKACFSSQDANSCSFHPSCSVYAMDAIRAYGPIIGIISWFDRYSRCNGLSPELYTRDPETQLLHDPVKLAE